MNTLTRRKFGGVLAAGAAAASGLAGTARAGSFPVRAVQIVQPYGAGTGLDAVTRFLAQELTQEWKVPVTTENRSGAGGLIGTEYVSRATPDGYTLMTTTTQSHFTAALLSKKPPYDPLHFVPVAKLTAAPLVMVCATSKFSDLRQVIAAAKGGAGHVTCASQGNGTSAHMALTLLNSVAGTQVMHVPYKEAAKGLTDTIRGEIGITFVTINSAASHVKAGTLRALAVTGSKRAAALPGVPALAEIVPGFEYVAWHGMFAPPGTPKAVVDAISEGVLKVAGSPRFGPLLEQQGLELALASAEEFAAIVPVEAARITRLVTEAGIKVE